MKRPAVEGERAPVDGGAGPVVPRAHAGDAVRWKFRRGKRYPRAISWFGLSSFWGHVWHMAASVIATEDIDARGWMHCKPSGGFTRDVADSLMASGVGESLTERLEQDLWIDYLADTGDDSALSAAVADMLFRDYQLAAAEGGEFLPRGRLLMFGGDTAYPVATAMEIHNRVSVPFNEVLMQRVDDQPRVLLGIPGNHDWYDGLDGFGRMFRARRGTVDRRTLAPLPTANASSETQVDKGGQIGHFIDWVEAFRVGRHVTKRPALPLVGYTPVQTASYFCLRLAPNLDFWAVDRQLRTVDYQQRGYFLEERDRAPEGGLMVALPDPAYQMLEPYAVGQATLSSLELSIEDDCPLVIAGDTHHYCRQELGRALHVTAGGGGAFLHPARIPRRGVTPPAAEFPGPRACAALALGIPTAIATGRAGLLVHLLYLVLYLPAASLHLGGNSMAPAAAMVGVVAALVGGALGGWRKRRHLLIGLLALALGLWSAATPYAVGWLVERLATPLGSMPLVSALMLLGSCLIAAFGFGMYLTALTVLGLEQHQAFSALAHPGYKHFVRLRIRQDGSRVDGWVLGKVDPLDDASQLLLVDRWTWHNPGHAATSEHPLGSKKEGYDGDTG